MFLDKIKFSGPTRLTFGSKDSIGIKVALDFCPTLTSFILIKSVVEHRIANPVVPSSNLGGFFFFAAI